MTWATSPADGGRRSGRWWVAAAVLLLVAAGCLTVGLRARPGGPPDPVALPLASPSAAGGDRAPAPPDPLGVLLPVRSAPVALRIPALGLAVPLSRLGLNPDGTVEVPTDFQEPGWFRLGPTPGQVGSAVILGHVDSYRGPAVFFRLRSLRAGDRVEVRLADGVVAHFAVRAVESYLKREFPARRVYGSRGYPALHLVTCGGTFDTRTRSYLSNVVVYTSLVATTPATAHSSDEASGARRTGR